MTRPLLLTLSAAVWLAGCGPAPVESKAPAPLPPVDVQTIVVAEQSWPVTYEATGTVRARTTAAIAAKWMGVVREVRFRVGERVQPGQVLVVLDARDLDANAQRAQAGRDEVRGAIPEADSVVAAAKANLDLAQVTFNRMTDLLAKRSVSRQEFDEASAKLKGVQAGYDMARAKRGQLDAKIAQVEQEVRATEVARSYAEVTAPFAGVVTAKSVDPGAMAVPGAPLLTVEQEGVYRLEAQVEESRLTAIRAGQSVAVTLDGIDRTLTARVSEIVPAVDAASRSYTVKIDLPSLPELRSGAFGRAEFRMGSRKALAIPVAAMREQGHLQSVLAADNGVARTRLITAGVREKDNVEVLSGLSAGERVIFPVPPGIEDGRKIEVRR